MNLFKIKIKNSIYYQPISIVGLICLPLLINQSKYTLIPFIEILAIIGISNLVITVSFWNFFKKKLNIYWSLIHNISYGCLFAFIFLFTNDILSTDNVKSEEYYIEKISNLNTGGRRQTTKNFTKFQIKIDGVIEEFTINANTSRPAYENRKVNIDLKNGFWNYKVVKDIRLEKQ